MKGFRAGEFLRESVPRPLRHFSPTESVESLDQIDLESLWRQGKRLLLLDVDNTLLPWRAEEVPEATLGWIARAHQIGFKTCLVSNTRHPERLYRLAERMGTDTVRDKFKPSRRMFLAALQRYGLSAEQAVTVGDQLLTDVLGANRSGIDAVWVRPIGKREFVGTRLLSRQVERVLGWFLYRHFRAEDGAAPLGMFRSGTLRRAVKFMLVGGLSTLIDVGLHGLLMFAPVFGGQSAAELVGTALLGGGAHPAKAVADAAFAPLKVPATGLAILNSYFWNRRWTFRVDGGAPHGPMVARFYAVALVGLVLNIAVGTLVNRALRLPPGSSWAGATAVATVAVFFWNFFGQSHFTFRGHAR
jgi:hypothetical protein